MVRFGAAEAAERGEVDLRAGTGFLLMRGGDQAGVVGPSLLRLWPGRWGDRLWTCLPMMNGTAAPAGLPSRNTSILARFSGS
jgi:hypothetical protein